MSSQDYIKGRGAQHNSHNKYSKEQHELRDDFLNYCEKEGEFPNNIKTRYLEVYPKTIVNTIKSPDVGMEYSLNPYQGCEHGCVYCYARNSHEYWGYSAGIDFESTILVKKEAPQLLEKKLKSKKWKARPIVLSGNTDCYQPAENIYKITRQCLSLFLKYKHPVGIITKNGLILRDLDLLTALAKDNLIAVNISITTLTEDIRRILEPRTATIKKRLNTLKTLSENGIPVNVMIAPIIPSINSHEILPMAKAASDNGALSIGHTIVRLNGAVGDLFADWLKKTMPNRAIKVLRQIESCHGGQVNDSRFGTRMRGEGKIAEHIHSLVAIARNKYFKDKAMPTLNTKLHEPYKDGQLKLF